MLGSAVQGDREVLQTGQRTEAVRATQLRRVACVWCWEQVGVPVLEHVLPLPALLLHTSR